MVRPFYVAGHCVGCIWQVGGQRVFVKIVRRERHFLRQLAAYAIDRAVLAALQGERVDLVRIEEEDTGHAFEIPLARFIALGQIVDLGFREQVAVPVRNWRTVGQPELPIPLEVA